MKFAFLFLSIILFATCNTNEADTKAKKNSADSSPSVKSNSSTAIGNDKKDSTATTSANLLMPISMEMLQALKTKDFPKLATFINPRWGLRFTPYAYIDTNASRRLTASRLVELGRSQKIIKWGLYDGTGEPINLSIDRYFDKFVYTKDFLTVKRKTMDKSNGGGNSLDNLKEIYPDAHYTEFYFSGSDPKYGSMDWQKLRLVFKTQDDRPYLIAIVHDEWTI